MKGSTFLRLLCSPAGVAITYFVMGIAWIFGSDRVLNLVVADPATVQAVQMYKGWAYVSITAVLLYWLCVNMMARLGSTRDRLKQTRENFWRLVESSHDGMWVVDKEGRVVLANARLAAILGEHKDSIVARGVESFLLPESVAPAQAPEIARDARIVRLRRGAGEAGWGIISTVKLSDHDGVAAGELRVLTDITRTKQAEEALRSSLRAERTLLNELDHRVRNNLASLLTLVELTRRNARSVDDFASQIQGRVGAMAATHSLLAESKFTAVDLGRLISVITEAEQEHRLEREGPSLTLGPAQAGPVAMILQELWANSVKHGALGAPTGRVRIQWEEHPGRQGDRVVRLSWQDSNGPRVSPPSSLGFGLSLVKGLSQSDLHGSFDADFATAGARFVFEFPVQSAADAREMSAGHAAGA
jgi:PAS domain S-box-containing protein